MSHHNGTDDWSGLPPIDPILEELATEHTGLGFIYASLDMLATRYGVDDVTIVLASDSLGAQMFRLERRAISTRLANELRSRPGIYCTPDVVPPSDLEAVYNACERSLPSKLDRFSSAHAPASSTHSSMVRIDDLKPLYIRLRTKLGESMTTFRNFAAVSQRGAGIFDAKSIRAYVSQFLIVLDIVVFIMAMADVHGPVRLFLGLIFGIIVPGWSIVGFLRLESAALEFGLTIAVSLSLLMIAAQVLITLSLWHLVAFEEITCAGCLPFLWLQSRQQRRLGQHSRK